MNSVLDDLKNAFRRPNNGLMRIILINLIVFLVLLVINVISKLSQADQIYDVIVNQLSLPAFIGNFIYKPWTIVTYFFTHEGFLHILFNMLFLYWFGSIIMEFLGSEKLVNLYVLGGLCGGMFYMLIYNVLPFFSEVVYGSTMLGASAGVFAVVVGAATFSPDYTFSLLLLGPVRIKYIALFYVILSFAQAAGTNAGGELAHLAGAAVGFIFIKQLKKGNDLGKPITRFFTFFKGLFVKQPRIKVTYYKNKNGNRKSAARKAFKSRQEEIDAILDKISESGYDSLSKEEKQKLFDASKS